MNAASIIPVSARFGVTRLKPHRTPDAGRAGGGWDAGFEGGGWGGAAPSAAAAAGGGRPRQLAVLPASVCKPDIRR